ncbi:hypothetical protein KR093_010567, partial [Drosophila rubida]
PPSRVQPVVMPLLGQVGQYTNKLHYLRKYLLDELITKKFAMDFMEPVDAEALQVPNYYHVITRPMDVGTIIKRVHNRYYHRVDDLISDFRLVISNCFTFNQPGDVVYRNCQKLEKFFHRVLNKMPRGEEKPSTKDPRGSGSEKNSEAVQRQCRELLRKLQISISNEDDKSIHKYFNSKLEVLTQRVDKNEVRTVEEFRFEVNNIFQEFDAQVRTLFDFYHRVSENESQPQYDRCRNVQDQSNVNNQQRVHPCIDNNDISELLCTLKTAEVGVEQCQKAYSREREQRARELIHAFYLIANRVKQKLRNDNTGVYSDENGGDPLVEEHTYNPYGEGNALKTKASKRAREHLEGGEEAEDEGGEDVEEESGEEGEEEDDDDDDEVEDDDDDDDEEDGDEDGEEDVEEDGEEDGVEEGVEDGEEGEGEDEDGDDE